MTCATATPRAAGTHSRQRWIRRSGQLKSITAYRELDYDAYQDQSGNPFLPIFRNEMLDDSQHQFSEEVQLVGATENEAISYVAGLYYFRESGEEFATDEISLINLDLPRHLTAREHRVRGVYVVDLASER